MPSLPPCIAQKPRDARLHLEANRPVPAETIVGPRDRRAGRLTGQSRHREKPKSAKLVAHTLL